MLIANFLQTISYEFKDFMRDIKLTFTEIFSSWHHFLNKFMSDDVLLVFVIGIGAFLLILVFRAIINRD